MSMLFATRGDRAVDEVIAEDFEFARSHGLETLRLAYRAGLVAHLRSMGEWERALAPRRRSRAALKEPRTSGTCSLYNRSRRWSSPASGESAEASLRALAPGERPRE